MLLSVPLSTYTLDPDAIVGLAVVFDKLPLSSFNDAPLANDAVLVSVTPALLFTVTEPPDVMAAVPPPVPVVVK